MIKPGEITPALVGALVRYDGGFEPEYGLVRTYNSLFIFVSFDVGDTAQACTADQLTLLVPAERPQNAPPPVPELDAETYNEVMELLLDSFPWEQRRRIMLADRIKNQIGRSAQKRAGRRVPSDTAEL